MNGRTSRRRFLAGSLPALAVPGTAPGAKPLKVVCVGGHPDDPESGCGGTLARYRAAGHQVTVVYLTRGERGIAGKSLDEAAAIRTAEAQAACRILGAKPVFAGQIDGATEIHAAAVKTFQQVIAAEAPDVLFTQWPIDTHPDHQVAALLSLRAYYAAGRRFALYFYEVNAGFQTQCFQPTDYVDIAAVREKKKAALFAHQSQGGEEIYRKHHEVMENFRGREARVAAAEALVRYAGDASAGRPPLL
jgi:LmbE family N-acetylglucosaminyl deacetylase